jgi:hypothetical protein
MNKPYPELSVRGQARHLRQLAVNVLTHRAKPNPTAFTILSVSEPFAD